MGFGFARNWNLRSWTEKKVQLFNACGAESKGFSGILVTGCALKRVHHTPYPHIEKYTHLIMCFISLWPFVTPFGDRNKRVRV